MSPKDTSLLKAICTYTVSGEELPEIMSKFDDPNNRVVALAIVGKIDPSKLDENSQNKVKELKEWSSERMKRIHDEQVQARRLNKETKFAKNLLKLKRLGKADELMCILFGVSGPIPDINPANNLQWTKEEKKQILQERMLERFGEKWRDYFDHLPEWLGTQDNDMSWITDGF